MVMVGDLSWICLVLYLIGSGLQGCSCASVSFGPSRSLGGCMAKVSPVVPQPCDEPDELLDGLIS